MVSRPMALDLSQMLLPRLYSTLNTGLPWARKVLSYACETDQSRVQRGQHTHQSEREREDV